MTRPYTLSGLERRERELQAPIIEQRQRRLLPMQLETARQRVCALENQARRFGMHHLLEG